ncbi:MAG: NAD(P)-binding domain-containing protein [Kofleriaceae bacterium]|nr:NAD(P)-binding domain-containing protein [Kofleriaceae bacterium]
MNIAIIGSGNIGAGLARAWRKAGHAVVFGARNPADGELVSLCEQIGARATTVEDSVRGAELVAFAMPHAALEDVLNKVGDLAGRTVIDCTNAVVRGATGISIDTGHSSRLQARLPAAHVFKTFNAQGAENLANPSYDGIAATNFFCGNDAPSRAQVAQLITDIGFTPIDLGPLANEVMLEQLMLMWMACFRVTGTRDIAFKLLRR